jgi:hypothetical protein
MSWFTLGTGYNRKTEHGAANGTRETDDACRTHKKGLTEALFLRIPNLEKPCMVFCHQKEKCCRVLTQNIGMESCPVGYHSFFIHFSICANIVWVMSSSPNPLPVPHSKRLEGVALGLPGCLSAIFAITFLLQEATTLGQ